MPASTQPGRGGRGHATKQSPKKEIEKNLQELENVLSLVEDWVSRCLFESLAERGHSYRALSKDLEHTQHLLAEVDQQAKRASAEDRQQRDKERELLAELEGLRGRLHSQEQERHSAHQREERMQRQC